MKKRNFNIKAAVLFVCIAFTLCLSAFAITPREMLENGEVSDGSVIYGDERDGIVSDVSSEMGDVRDEIGEFAESMLPDMSGAEENRTSGNDTQSEPMTTDRADKTQESTKEASDGETADGTMDARWGVVIAVIVVVAVVAAVFLLVKRK